MRRGGAVMWVARILLGTDGGLMLLAGGAWLGGIAGTGTDDRLVTSVVTALLLADGLALVALALALPWLPRRVTWFGVALVVLNLFAVVTDQVGAVDIAVLVLNAVALVALVVAAPGARDGRPVEGRGARAGRP